MVLEITRFKEIDDMTLGRFILRDGEKEVLKGYTCEPTGPDTTQSGMDTIARNLEFVCRFYGMSWYQKLAAS